jgi:hypothetical protein
LTAANVLSRSVIALSSPDVGLGRAVDRRLARDLARVRDASPPRAGLHRQTDKAWRFRSVAAVGRPTESRKKCALAIMATLSKRIAKPSAVQIAPALSGTNVAPSARASSGRSACRAMAAIIGSAQATHGSGSGRSAAGVKKASRAALRASGRAAALETPVVGSFEMP